MKVFYLTLAGFCFMMAGYAQTNDTVVIIHPRGYDGKLSLSIWKPTLVTENKNGKIVSLPLDNMFCLVPNLKNQAPIPTKKLIPDDLKMPNKIP